MAARAHPDDTSRSFRAAAHISGTDTPQSPATPRTSYRAPGRKSACRSYGVPVTASDVDVHYVWHEAPVPPGLEITQVYGYLICPQTARVLVQDDGGVFNLPGGTPEPCDGDLFATLAREAAEENQVRIDDAAYLGFQEVHRPDRAPYAQVRMAGRIAGFDPRRPDPDGGRIYRRPMCPLHEAPDVLGWGDPAVAQANAAARVAAARWGLDVAASGGAGCVD
jgi:8-oxo-dGTP diphosphatase